MTDESSAVTPSDRFAALRSRRVRWLAPVAVGGAVAAAVVVPVVANAAPSLPPRTAAQLLVDLQRADEQQFSGTVVETARLGFPALPDMGASSIPLTSLLAGSRTARVWYGGAEHARIALVGNLAETDLIRNGDDAWLWTSGKNTAQRLRLPAGSPQESEAAKRLRQRSSTAEALTPQAAADRALAAVDQTTKVTVEGTATVAGREAYELVLAPRSADSLVREVRVAVDAKTSMPLRVRIFAVGASADPAFEVGFATLSYGKPDAAVFRFTPPAGATVTTSDLALPAAAPTPGRTSTAPQVIGTGWASVLRVDGVDLDALTSGSGSSQAGVLTSAMKPVNGAYGSGRLLTTKLLSVLVLDDGRAYVGAVTPAALERAAGR